MSPIIIRKYELKDRPAVRRIVCDTADAGAPIESFFSRRDIAADFLTGYYTDYEQGSLWVAESGETVVGFLSGCLDSRAFLWTVLWRVLPRVIFKAVVEGVWLKKESARLLSAWVRTWRQGGFSRSIPSDKYPAHLHINLTADFRGRHIGRELVERFIGQAQKAGAAGIHASVRQDNTAACLFFEGLGFAALNRYPIVLPQDTTQTQKFTVVYGKRI